jgi:hypothetical protein
MMWDTRRVVLNDAACHDVSPSCSGSVLLFQLTVPGSILLTRGNHEARDINTRSMASGGGFSDEVLQKYDESAFELFQAFFKHLPLCATVGGQIFVVHGGLTREVHATIDDFRHVSHRRDIPETPSSRDDGLLFDLMWSDPQEADGICSGARGDSVI